MTTAQALLDQVSRLCLALPATATKLSHGTPAFSVSGKMFVYFLDDHHGDGITSVCVKTSGLEEQAMLIESDPDLYYRPAYIGPAGWVGLRLDHGPVDWDHVEDRIRTSWRLAAPRKLAGMI
nr:MmcQ/YjbR family DNA-binding protein [Sphingomonas oleivorans]